MCGRVLVPVQPLHGLVNCFGAGAAGEVDRSAIVLVLILCGRVLFLAQTLHGLLNRYQQLTDPLGFVPGRELVPVLILCGRVLFLVQTPSILVNCFAAS